MLSNATLTRIDVKGTANPQGQVSYVEGATLKTRCALDAVGSKQIYRLGQVARESDAVAYVPSRGLIIETGFRVQIQLDQGQPVLYLVVDRTERAMEDLSHYELIVKKV